MKVHLLDSAEPLKEGTDLMALCGAEVPKAKFAMMWDEQQMGLVVLSSLLACHKCKAKIPPSFERKYWYGIVPGQEATPREEL